MFEKKKQNPKTVLCHTHIHVHTNTCTHIHTHARTHTHLFSVLTFIRGLLYSD